MMSNIPKGKEYTNKSSGLTYTCEDLIAQGQQGRVYKVIDKTGNYFAMKQYFSIREPELKLLNSIKANNHPSFLNIYEIFQFEGFECIISEYCEEGNLENEMKKKRNYTELEAMMIIKNLSEQLEIIHKEGYILQDLKPANIIIKTDKYNIKQYKICDFGSVITEFSFEQDAKLTKSRLATPCYQAPESMLDDKIIPITYFIDIWALGLIFYELLTGVRLFDGNVQELKTILKDYKNNQKNKQQEISQRINDTDIRQMIFQMIDINPIQRYNLRAIQQIIQLKEKEYQAAFELGKTNFQYQIKLQREVCIRQEFEKEASSLVMELKLTNLKYQAEIQKDADIKESLKEKIKDQQQQLKKYLEMLHQRKEQEVKFNLELQKSQNQIRELEEKINQLNKDLSKNSQR